jgi:hypothetical protein
MGKEVLAKRAWVLLTILPGGILRMGCRSSLCIDPKAVGLAIQKHYLDVPS